MGIPELLCCMQHYWITSIQAYVPTSSLASFFLYAIGNSFIGDQMMQFTESSSPYHALDQFTPLATYATQFHRVKPLPSFPTSPKSRYRTFGDANSMEQLLIHCANAIENNDTTLSQHILWVLNNIASPDGDSNQRLAWGFLRALIIRATKSGTCKQLTTMITTQEYSNLALHTHRFSILELVNYVDLTPWHRFGYTAANAAILNAIQVYQIIHIVDISSTHCMQIPTLIDSIATRLQKLIKLTVTALTDETPPMLESISSYHSIATKLTLFAKKCHNIVLEFTIIPTPLRHIVEHLACIESNPNEALIVNCQMTLHMITHQTMESPRRKLMDSIRAIDPAMVTVVDEDVDFSSRDLVSRVRSAWEFFWVRFDAAETFMGERKWERERYF